jgi:hypothetical protein
VETRNVTVALPRTLLRRVKVVAATRDTSISALLASALEEIAGRDEERRRAARRTVARAREGYDLGTRGRALATRDQLHDR